MKLAVIWTLHVWLKIHTVELLSIKQPFAMTNSLQAVEGRPQPTTLMTISPIKEKIRPSLGSRLLVHHCVPGLNALPVLPFGKWPKRLRPSDEVNQRGYIHAVHLAVVRTALHECTSRSLQEVIVSTCVLMKRQPLTMTSSLLAVEGLIPILRLTTVNRLWPDLYTANKELYLQVRKSALK